MAALFANHLVSVMRPNFYRNQVPHAARRHEQRGFLPKNLRRPLFQFVYRRIFSINVIAHLGRRHRAPHLVGRPSHRVAAQIHCAIERLPGQFHLIRVHSLISLRHRVTHGFPSSVILSLSDEDSGKIATSSPLFLSLGVSFSFLISSAPRTPHLTRSVSVRPAVPGLLRAPASPLPPGVAASPREKLRIPSRSVPRLFPAAAATPKTTLLRAPAPRSRFPTAPRAIFRSPSRSHTPRSHVRLPIVACRKTNAPPRQIPSRARASNTSSCASIRIPASPNWRSRNADIRRLAASPAPVHKTPPSHRRLALSPRCTAFRRSTVPSPAGFLRPPLTNTRTRAPAEAQSAPQAIASNFFSFGAAIRQSNRS